MFIAKTSDGQIVSLMNVSRETLTHLKKQEQYFCPACSGELLLKMGMKKLPHFAHKSQCSIKPEGESQQHLLGKKKLFHWLTWQGFETQMECYLSELNQQPDLLFQWNGKKGVIEFQCSIIPLEEMYRRTTNYINHSYRPLWIVDHRLITAQLKHRVQLNEFLTHFITRTSSGDSFILAMDPREEKFYTYHHIVPYSINRAFVTVQEFTLQERLEKLLISKDQSFPFYDYWFEETERWVKRLLIIPNGRKNTFLQFLYHHHLHLLDLPPEVGVPVPDMFIIKNSPIEWQFYIWFYFLYQQRLGAVIPLEDIYSFLGNRLKQLIVQRQLGRFQKSFWRQPVEAYLQFLTNIGFFRREGDKLIVKKIPLLINNPNVYRENVRRSFFRRYKGLILQLFFNSRLIFPEQ